MTSWVDWPYSERQSPPGGPASEMNELFFSKWTGRDEGLRARPAPGLWLGGTRNVSGDTVGSWVDSGFGSRLIWIPPWAATLTVRLCLAVTGAGTPGIDTLGYARPKLGTVYGSEVHVSLACDTQLIGPPGHEVVACTATLLPGTDGHPDTGTGVLYDKTSTIDIPAAMLDTEQDFSWETKRGNSDCGIIRIFNDVEDASDGDRHRHWFWVEAA